VRPPVELLAVILVKPALVLGAAATIAALLRGRTAAARHAVWAGAIVATLALPILSRVLPPLRLLLPVPVAGIEGTLPIVAWLEGTTPGSDHGPPIASGLPGGRAARTGSAGFEDRISGAMISLWLLGILVLAARRVTAEVRMRRILGRARVVSDPKLTALFAEISRSSGAPARARLLLSAEITSPAVAGLIRPAVLLPASTTWTDAELSPVLIHELGHVRRRDCLLDLLADFARIVYWCNPVVRFGVRRMRSESERACDDLVLRQGTEPEGYAHLLLRLARAAGNEGGLPSAVVAMARPRELESRLLAVLDPRVPRNALPRCMPAALAGLGVMLALPAAAFTLHAAAPPIAGQMAMEPDRLADSLAGPESERLPFAPDRRELSLRATEALEGPDSALARLLVAASDHLPGHPGDLVAERARWAIWQVRNGRLVEPLLEALDSSDWRAQAYAAWTLAAAPDPRATSRLIPMLAHPVWRLRAMAAFALRASGDPAAQGPMSAALSDPAWQVRLEAVEYFAVLGGPALSQRLRPRLGDRHVAVRHAAEAALTSR